MALLIAAMSVSPKGSRGMPLTKLLVTITVHRPVMLMSRKSSGADT